VTKWVHFKYMNSSGLC